MKFHNFSLNRVFFFGNEKEEKNSRPGEIIYIYIYSFFRDAWQMVNPRIKLVVTGGVIMINLFPSVIRHGYEFAWEIKYA